MTSRIPSIILMYGFFLLSLTGVASAQMPPANVDIAHPIEKEVVEYYEYTGRFRAVNEVDIRSRVSGYLKEVRFKDGQNIKKDDILFVIDKRPYKAAYDQAAATLKSAIAAQKLSELEVARGESLLQRNNISKDDVDKRRADLEGAIANVENAEAALEAAALNLEFTEVKAPFDGRLSDRQVDVGTYVSGGSDAATLLTTIVSSGQIQFYFDAPEADYLHFIRMDMAGKRSSARYDLKTVSAKLSDEEGWSHHGVLDFVDNRINSNTGTIRAHAVFDNSDDILLPGYFGRLRLPALGPHVVIMVPDEAIVSDQTTKIVYKINEKGLAAPQPVTLGPVIDGLRVVRTGLTKEDTIVINGVIKVRPGAKVQGTMVPIKAK